MLGDLSHQRVRNPLAHPQRAQPDGLQVAQDARNLFGLALGAPFLAQTRAQPISQKAQAYVVDHPELFGHWWYEGPEFLDLFVRKACCDQKVFELITPAESLRQHPTHQVATPAASSWGEEGYWRVWLNEKNEWIYPHL